MSAALCIQSIITRAFELQISEAHAETLWKATRAVLNSNGSRKVVKAAKEFKGGSLDTYEREILMDAMGVAMTTMHWTSFGDPTDQRQLFDERAYAYLRGIGAITTEQDPYLARIKTLVEVDDAKGMTIRVQKRVCGLYDIARKIQGKSDEAYEIKHQDCTADDAIRALGHYLHF